MAITINTNVPSLNAQRNLNHSQNALNTAMQRLSSGLRINSAKDDAAGLAISDRMTSQIRGLNQAARNANDGISLAQTAEGALQESTNILQRMRELAVQSANDTNSASDRASINDELVQLQEELDRIAETTEFNGRKLIDGSMAEGTSNIATFQVGANAGVNQTISFGIASSQGKDLSYVGTTIQAPNGNPVVGSDVTGNALADGDLSVNGSEVRATDGTNIDLAAAINEAAGATIAAAQNVQAFEFDTVSLDNTETVTGSPGQAGITGVTAVAEVQTQDLTGITGAIGDDITWTFGDGETATFTLTAAITGDGDMDAALNGVTITDSAGRDWDIVANSGDGTITLTQASGDEAPAGAISATTVTDNNSSAATDPTVATGSVSTPGVAAVAEVQTQDLTGITGGIGDIVTWTFGDGETATFTLTAAITDDTDMDAALNGVTITDSAGRDWDLAASGNDGSLTLTQASGDEAPAGAITGTTIDSVAGFTGTGTQDTPGVDPGTPEVQSQDLTGITGAIGDTITWTFADGSTGSFTLAAAINDDTDMDTALHGATFTDSEGSAWGIAATGTDGTLTLTQTSNNRSTGGGIASTGVALAGNQAAVDTGSVTTPGVAADAEVQAQDLTGIAGEVGDDITWTFGDGETATFTLTAAITDDTDMDAALNGVTITDSAGRDWTIAASSNNGTITLTQAAGDESPAGAITATAVTDNTSGAAADPTVATGTVTAAGVTAVTAQEAIQNLDLSAVSVEVGATMVFTIEGEEVEYTATDANFDGSALTGSVLVADIANQLNTVADIGNGSSYTFSVDGVTDTQLNITQVAGSEAPLADNITGDYGVRGTYTLDFDGTSFDVSAAVSGAEVTAQGLVDAINNDATLTATGFSADLNDDGEVEISLDGGAAFSLAESIDADADGTDDGPAAGLAGVGETAADYLGQISLDSNSNIVLAGDGLVDAGLNEVGNATTTIDQINVLNRDSAVVAIASVDAAISKIDEIRGGLGAVQNRFESTIANLANVSENLSAARSRIMDADIAEETSAMIKNNILQQAGVSILVQANQAPQMALSLLQ